MDFACIFCLKTHTYASEMTQHLEDHFANAQYCKNCDGRNRGSAHCDDCLGEDPPDEEEAAATCDWVQAYLSPHKTRSNIILGCPLCQYQLEKKGFPKKVLALSSLSAIHAKLHLVNHFSYNPFNCNICKEKSFGSTTLLRAHAKKDHKKKFKQTPPERLYTVTPILKLEQYIDYLVANSRSEDEDEGTKSKFDQGNEQTTLEGDHFEKFEERKLVRQRNCKLTATRYLSVDSTSSESTSPESIEAESEPPPPSTPSPLAHRKQRTIEDDEADRYWKMIYERHGLKPQSIEVRLERLSNDRIASLKVIDDPTLIASENESPIRNSLSEVASDDDESDENSRAMDAVSSSGITCLFCFKQLVEREEALLHYQTHLNYKPVSCGWCYAKSYNTELLMEHHRMSHKRKEFAFKHSPQKVIDDWLDTFTEAQFKDTITPKKLANYDSCPVCILRPSHHGEKRATNEPQHGRVICHVYRHILYQPFQCSICNTFRVGFVDIEAVRHLKLAHKLSASPKKCWEHFDKVASIPALEDFIADYLEQFLVTVDDYLPVTLKRNSSNNKTIAFERIALPPRPPSPPNSIRKWLVKFSGAEKGEQSSEDVAMPEPKRRRPSEIVQLPMDYEPVTPPDDESVATDATAEEESDQEQDSTIDKDDSKHQQMLVELAAKFDVYSSEPEHSPLTFESSPIQRVITTPAPLSPTEAVSSCSNSSDSRTESNQVTFTQHKSVDTALDQCLSNNCDDKSIQTLLKRHFCIFCEEHFTSDASTKDHYLRHYRTFEENQSAPCIDQPVKSFNFKLAEKWIDDFVSSQAQMTKADAMLCACSALCPVCHELRSRNYAFRCIQFSREFAVYHVHEHLAYRPWHCPRCCNTFAIFRELKNHLLSAHESLAGKYFMEHKQPLPWLEEFIGDHIRTKEENYVIIKIKDEPKDSAQLSLAKQRKSGELNSFNYSSNSGRITQYQPTVVQRTIGTLVNIQLRKKMTSQDNCNNEFKRHFSSS